MYVYVRLCVNVYHVQLGKDVGENYMSDHLKLELNAIVNCLMWVLVTKLGSPGISNQS